MHDPCIRRSFPPSYFDGCGLGWNYTVSEDAVKRPFVERLDIVVEHNVGKQQFKLVSNEPTSRAAKC